MNDTTNEPLNNVLGQLTPEEQTCANGARQRGQQILLRIGELAFQASRMRQQQNLMETQISNLREKESLVIQEQQDLCEELDGIEQEGRAIVEQVTHRLNLDPGIQWIALENGTIQRMEK